MELLSEGEGVLARGAFLLGIEGMSWGGDGVGSPGVFFFDVLDRASAFYAADGETGRVAEAADHPRLPLQRTLHRFVEFGRVLQVDDVDVSIRRRDHQQLILHVHTVDSLLAVHAGYGRRLSQIPVFDRLVPRARDEYGPGAVRHVDEADASDGLVVRRDLDGGRVAGVEVEEAGCFVGAAADDFGAILRGRVNVLW